MQVRDHKTLTRSRVTVAPAVSHLRDETRKHCLRNDSTTLSVLLQDRGYANTCHNTPKDNLPAAAGVLWSGGAEKDQEESHVQGSNDPSTSERN